MYGTCVASEVINGANTTLTDVVVNGVRIEPIGFTCACVPTTCEIEGKNCGRISDGCPGPTSIDCGACSANEYCDRDNKICECVPLTCETQRLGCGYLRDECGNNYVGESIVECGSCQPGHVCSTNGTIDTSWLHPVFMKHSECLVCLDGTQPDSYGLICVPCPDGYAGTGGLCHPCSALSERHVPNAAALANAAHVFNGSVGTSPAERGAMHWRLRAEGPTAGGGSDNWAMRVVELVMFDEISVVYNSKSGSILEGAATSTSNSYYSRDRYLTDGEPGTYWSAKYNRPNEAFGQSFPSPVRVAKMSITATTWQYAPDVLVVEASNDTSRWIPVIRFEDFGSVLQESYDSATTVYTAATQDRSRCVCVPTTCEAVGAVCGTIDDRCGNTIACGDCPYNPWGRQGQCRLNVMESCTAAKITVPPTDCRFTPGDPASCGARAKMGTTCIYVAPVAGDNTCMCNPVTCENAPVWAKCGPGGGKVQPVCVYHGAECGTIDDGCGMPLQCGSCGAANASSAPSLYAEACDANHQCGCVPTTCEAEGAECGSISDRCVWHGIHCTITQMIITPVLYEYPRPSQVRWPAAVW
jgi:hypothetical protein